MGVIDQYLDAGRFSWPLMVTGSSVRDHAELLSIDLVVVFFYGFVA